MSPRCIKKNSPKVFLSTFSSMNFGLGSTDPSNRCTYSITTAKSSLSGRNHQRSPNQHQRRAVWPQPLELTIPAPASSRLAATTRGHRTAHTGQFLSQTSCHRVSQRHVFLRLITNHAIVKIILADVYSPCAPKPPCVLMTIFLPVKPASPEHHQ